MEASEIKCPLCHGPTEIGFLMDRMHGGRKPGEWIEGTPEPSFWRGIKISDRRRFVLEARRCVDCGYLLLFAANPSETSE